MTDRPDLTSMGKESISIQLVSDFEAAHGHTLEIAPRTAGFNGLAVIAGNLVKKIEIKTVDRSDNWFAINGLRAIECLFFDSRYYLYFVMIRERRIVVAQAIPFLQAQIPTYNPEVGQSIARWIDLTKTVVSESGLNLIPRVNFKLQVGIRQLVALLEAGRETDVWQKSIEGIWHSEAPHEWRTTWKSKNRG